MATADEPIMSKRSFAILIIGIFSFIFLISLYPVAWANAIESLFGFVEWAFTHLPIGRILVWGLLGTAALIAIGGAIMIYEKFKALAA